MYCFQFNSLSSRFFIYSSTFSSTAAIESFVHIASTVISIDRKDFAVLI